MALSTPSIPWILSADQKDMHLLMNGNHLYGDEQDSMQACIDACRRCHEACRRVLSALSLHQGGLQAEPSIRVLLECSDLCTLSADMQLMASPYRRRMCEICAEACRECEHQCMGTAIADDCAEACRLCAESCEAMAV